MKIAFVSHWSGSGGAEKALFEIVEHTHRIHGIPCICFVNWRGSLYRNLKSIGVRCYVIPYRWWCGEDLPPWKTLGRTIFNLPMALVLAALVVFERCTLVYTNTSTINVGALAAFITRRPHVWHMHELFGSRRFDLGERYSTALMDRLSSKVIVPSDVVADFYSQFVARQKIVRIYNAVKSTASLEAAKSVKHIPGRLVSVGAVNPQKGHDDAVRAVRLLLNRGLDVSLHIVGDIDQPKFKAHLDSIAKELGISSRVTFTGLLRDPFPEMQAAEVVLMCARGEAFGRVTAEAMLMRRPVVAASSGANPEIVAHGHTGLLYSPGSIDQLVEAVELLLRRPALAELLASNATDFAESNFTLERFCSEWLETMRAATLEKP
jgi:glycosyltransferase involved in cell wall biosynthesis